MFNQRITQFQLNLAENEAVLLSTANDIRYFSNFEFLVPEEREAFLVITKHHTFLIASAFSPLPAEVKLQLLPGCSAPSLAKHLRQIVTTATGMQLKKIKFQAQSLYVSELAAIKQEFLAEGKSGLETMIEFVPLATTAIWQQRRVKDASEIAALRLAGEIVAKAAEEISQYFKIGITELELTEHLGQLFTKYGSEHLGFPTIVAFGEHGTLPHHQPDHTPLTANTPILIDCGTMVSGYRSDLTRTWWFGDPNARQSQPDSQFSEIEKIVKQAYQLAVDRLATRNTSAPVFAKDLDKITRDFITKAGYGPQFIHTTGHGVGLDIHEPPSLSWNDDTELLSGMVITIEPGIYLPKKFGYRFENTLLITDTGAEVLTQSSQN